MTKFRYTIHNLDCANCAMKIEKKLQEDKRFSNATVNFTTSKITYEADSEIDIGEINRIVQSIEPDCTITKETTEQEQKKEYKVINLGIAIVCIVLSICTKNIAIISRLFIIIAYILLLYRPFINSIKMLLRNRTLNENALITISCIGAFFIGQDMEGIMVVLLYTIGKILEDKAVNKSRNSIKALLEIKQDYANLVKNEKIIKVDVEKIKCKDILVIKKGEKVPVDGIVTKGKTKLDTSPLTGESLPLEVKKEDVVLSGSINLEDVIEIEATTAFENSTVSKILELINDASDKKAKTETIVAKMSKYYTPIILLLAIVTVVILALFTSIGFEESLYRGLTFLVISCPCAIAISVPLSYFTGIGVCSKAGILIKGSNYLDLLGHTNKIVFDKTGTITNGSFQVKEIKITDKSYTREQIIDIITAGESFSTHPIAQSIMRLTKKINKKEVTNFQEKSGEGISYEYQRKKIKLGSYKMCKECQENVNLHLNIDGVHVASITMDDGVKENVPTTLDCLKEQGIKTYLFTGDKKDITKEITKNLSFNGIKAEMLPQDKYHEYEELHEEKDIIAFVGDGINDAPLLKRADIGISMGAIGSDAAIEASDIVIMNDDIKKINQGIAISKYTTKIIIENLCFAICTKVIILLLSVFG
ncbi:MAG: cadmium-translocating P-type ATPase, partial [Bacilli bacterium]|nr:cadmium-translocating P-type ATPase [Bacilli bacterium]